MLSDHGRRERTGIAVGRHAFSEPIETDFGWHIVQVLEREERELSPVDYTQQQREAFTEWTNTVRQDAVIEDFWTPEMAPESTFLEQFQ